MRLFGILFSLALFGCTALPLTAGPAGENAAKAVVIDVRSQKEWSEGHLEGAVLLPLEQVEAGIEKVVPDRKQQIQLYCRTGRRSGIAQESLKKLGYENVSNEGSLKEASEKLRRPIVK